MKFLFCLTLVFTVLQIGHTLTCWKCNGCETTSVQKETCRNVDPEKEESACLTQIIRTGGTADSMTIKKCVHFDKNEPFYCQTLPTGDTVSCEKCRHDFCNSSTTMKTNFFVYLSLALVLVPNFL